MQSVFDKYDNLEVQFEYMDTKRNTDPAYLEEFSKLYELKHNNIPFKVIIASDNSALEFTRKFQNKFFKNIPIVFASIDQFDDSLIQGMTNVTGVTENIDFKRTIEEALILHPKAKNLVVINDNITNTAIINRNHIISFWPSLKTNVNLVFFENLTIDELIKKVKLLDDSNIILLINFSQDKDGNYISYQENIDIIRNATNLPIYSSWQFYLNEGIVGGMLTSGFRQGELSAEIAIRVVNGENINTIPIVTEGYNNLIFDYNQMKRFGISIDQLPEGSSVINVPPSFLQKYRISIFTSLVFILLLILFFVFARSKRKRNERRLLLINKELENNRNRLLKMLDANSDGVWEHDILSGRVSFSKQIWLKLGYAESEIQDTKEYVDAHLHPDDISRIESHRQNYLSGGTDLFNIEFRLISINKDWKWYKAKGKILDSDKNGNPTCLVGTLTDITQRKIAEEQVKETERKILNAVISTEENERKRFALDLHDSIGPLLSSINLYISALEEPVTKEIKDSIIKVSHEAVNEAVKSIKEISNNLSPHILNDFGLTKAIDSFTNKLSLSNTINISFSSENMQDRLNEQIEVVIYRVVTELINNTIKHAKANNIEINLSKDKDSLKLIYIDDGIGVDAKKIVLGASNGMGLYNILSRVKSLNGKTNIKNNTKQRGMIAIIEIPLL